MSSADRWKRIKEVFDAALDRTARELEAFLIEACGDDKPLRLELDHLLAQHEQAGDFLDALAVELRVGDTDRNLSRSDEDTFPQKLSHYEIVEPIGAGGMGTVF